MTTNNKQQSELQPQLRAVPMNLFPTAGTLNEVVELGNSRLPITNPNELFSLLSTYHNTLLKTMSGPTK
jgi:hypothetical protein